MKFLTAPSEGDGFRCYAALTWRTMQQRASEAGHVPLLALTARMPMKGNLDVALTLASCVDDDEAMVILTHALTALVSKIQRKKGTRRGDLDPT